MSKLFDIISRNVVSLLSVKMPDIEEYRPRERPRKAAPKIETAEKVKADENGFVGQWVKVKGEEHYEAYNVTMKQAPGVLLLDEYDTAYLNQLCPTWNKSEEKKHNTARIKNLWATALSAKKISPSLGEGYSVRTIDEYIKAFFEADKRRFFETQKCIRNETANNSSTV